MSMMKKMKKVADLCHSKNAGSTSSFLNYPPTGS